MTPAAAFHLAGKLEDSEFDSLFREHYSLVYRTAYSVTRSVEDAEDVAQTIFVRLLKREFPPDLRRNPKGYLYRAAVNASFNTLRTKRRELHRQDAATALWAAGEQSYGIPESLDEQLRAAMAALNPTAAQILLLRYVHDCSLTEIAQLMDTTRGTIAVSLFRSRAKLKKVIRGSRKGKT
jgi:RNA polymerase sigma-70 factor (ECF subfamily)